VEAEGGDKARFDGAAEEGLTIWGEEGVGAGVAEGHFYPEGLRGGVGESSPGPLLAGVPYLYLAGEEVFSAAIGGAQAYGVEAGLGVGVGAFEALVGGAIAEVPGYLPFSGDGGLKVEGKPFCAQKRFLEFGGRVQDAYASG